MDRGEEPEIADTVAEIAASLTAAYQRRAGMRLLPIPPEPLSERHRQRDHRDTLE